MALLEMQRLTAILPAERAASVTYELMRTGGVQLTVGDFPVPGLQGQGAAPGGTSDTEAGVMKLKQAQDALKQHLNEKRGLFRMRIPIEEKALLDPQPVQHALELAEQILALNSAAISLRADLEASERQGEALRPWLPLNPTLPLPRTRSTVVLAGHLPHTADLRALENTLSLQAPEACLIGSHSDGELHRVMILVHRQAEAAVQGVLSAAGFTPFQFPDCTGSLSTFLEEERQEQEKLRQRLEALEPRFLTLSQPFETLRAGIGLLTLLGRLQAAADQYDATERTRLLRGWVPKVSGSRTAEILSRSGCAFALEDPGPEEEPPIAFRHPALLAPFGVVTELYGMPAYHSLVDPTPYMAPFFFLFFGMMVSDAAYGALLSLISLWLLRQLKTPGFTRRVLTLAFYCGLSTLICGVLFGSWFGDSIPAVSRLLTGTARTLPPVWFDPLKQPMTMLVLSFVLGAIHLFVGLGISGWRKLRRGKPWDALYDVGFWYLFLSGLVLMLLSQPVGQPLAASGALGIVLTAGRGEKSAVRRLLKGVLALYGATGYLADVLSYSRLLALGLASGVIASVINAMGTLGGRTPFGLFTLAVVFIAGHTFNLAINLVGAYVHASRLQYVEFFGKFYEGGGSPFRPLTWETEHLEILRSPSPTEKGGSPHD